jgi:hypothetical protein
VGFNVVKNFNDELENVLWLDGEPRELGSTELSLPGADGEEIGRLSTPDGQVNLQFDPLGARSEELDFGVMASDYHQPIGHWSGTLAGKEVSELVGVCEDHYSRW